MWDHRGQELTVLNHYESFVSQNKKWPRLDTNLIPPFDPIFKSDNAEGNTSSNTKIPPQIMLLQKNPIARNNLSSGQLIRIQTGYGGHLLHHGRRLPRHGGRLHDDKSSEAVLLFFQRISLAGSSGSFVSERCVCKDHTAPGALLHTQTFSSHVWLESLKRLSALCFCVLPETIIHRFCV